MMSRPLSLLCCLSVAAMFAGCAASDPVAAGSGGSAQAGTGGAVATGGTVAAGTGGATATGGAVSATGGASTGGDSGSGGQPSGSGGSGSGGSSGTGGQAGGRGGSTAPGSGGAPPSGGGGQAAQANCPAGAAMCEDFESFTTGVGPTGNGWTSRTSGGATVVIDSTHPHSGTKSAHFHAMPLNNGTRAYILRQGAGFPVTGNTYFVRFMLYIGRYMDNGSGMHNRMVWMGPVSTLMSGASGPGYGFATYNGIAIERYTQPGGGFQRDTSQHMEDASRANKWQCFELELDNAGGAPPGENADSTVMPHIWQDGTALKLGAGGSKETWNAQPFEALQFSLWCPQTDTMAVDYWIDDVVVSTQRINCPTK